ncbi:Predicted kinase, aminoglycoside phosphotransferase (APT) family [Paraoerskovia marina]|uniref:Predicted kinase, aminoglycoside phosphotransferase (APT) family n=1 Tax=Paraoerskovia marina TaxID=545619 RepID=A0A1H1VVA9_9CELL|nr:aminoglycoside phosphotransferase family protein [Paraoerskovia marina]SDS88918.1 Predicted kinase, aminoglycoside phosphotransferase (APT) family [Paraoerskovia marina]
MHVDELDVDEVLVASLVAEQFPAWGRRRVVRVASAGTDNAMFRLGDDLVVRLPRVPGAAHQVAKEQRWLPYLAPHVPLHLPVPVGAGAATEAFPLPWSVYRWLDGDDALVAPPDDLAVAAEDLGRFVHALQRVPATGGPASFRGGPLSTRDVSTRDEIGSLGDRGAIDGELALAYWEGVLGRPQWQGDPVWLHSDLLPGNLLTLDGRLSAVIDFGGCGIGDPACDLMAGWTLFDAASRPVFRAASGVDDGTWARGRGWAFCFGIGAWHYYEVTNPALAAVGRRAALEVLSELDGTGRRGL